MTDELPMKIIVSRRLTKESRWTPEVTHERDSLLAHARDVLGMAKAPAQEWAYTQLNDKYPPLKEGEIQRKPRGKGKNNKSQTGQNDGGGGGAGDADAQPAKRLGRPPKKNVDQVSDDSGSVIGLNKIPDSWLPLPPNADIATEIQWVQSVRIDVVTELPTGGTIVRLERADRPAPSKSAIGWLETSIRAYSKYCDIASKAAANVEDEREMVRRERLSIEQVRSILAEMLEDKT